jgi:hypothetical protein
MTARERHRLRDRIVHANGYRPQPVPGDPEWAGRRLPTGTDEKAARAALELRGLPAPTESKKRSSR